ncbi:MAG TPA: cytochrome c [Candidatus Eisenbacteria bacterium]
MIRKLALGLLTMVGLALVGFAIFVSARQNLRFDAPYPPIMASADSAVIARGRHIVRDVAVCATCHSDPKLAGEIQAGAEVPLSGGRTWNIPPGRFYARNITPDPETGLGRISDQAVARALRYGVGHDGRALLPFMEMQGLSDQDLAAVVSYLRAQPPIRNVVPPQDFNLLGMVVRATVLARPVGPRQAPPRVSPRGLTVENGRYLAESVALCWACHTQRDMRTGALVGPKYAGATGMEEQDTPGVLWSPPNITADDKTGRLSGLSEDDFVARLRAGRAIPGSPMPWQGFQRMSDDELRAIYRYLKTVPPAERDVGPPFVKKG